MISSQLANIAASHRWIAFYFVLANVKDSYVRIRETPDLQPRNKPPDRSQDGMRQGVFLFSQWAELDVLKKFWSMQDSIVSPKITLVQYVHLALLLSKMETLVGRALPIPLACSDSK